MTEWDAPNQQVVRADNSAPWDEGSGGAGEETPALKSSKAKKADKTDDADTEEVAEE